ncbi:MAG TPA: hypothetical protein VEU33_09830 [Archangium sp.]|nr:hypothetical protein [Archangium sp.]
MLPSLDVYLLTRYAPLDTARLLRALRLAFESRGDSLELMERRMAGEFGRSPWSHEKWMRPMWEAARAA